MNPHDHSLKNKSKVNLTVSCYDATLMFLIWLQQQSQGPAYNINRESIKSFTTQMVIRHVTKVLLSGIQS